MKMMYVLPAEGFGGAERQGVLHIRSLPERGINLVAVIGAGAPMQEALTRYGCANFQLCDTFPHRTHRKMRIGGNLRFGAEYAKAFFQSSKFLEELGRESNVDLIFGARSFGWAVAARAAKALGVPYMIRAGSRPTNPTSLLAIRALRARYGRPAALLSNCRAVEKRLIGAFDCPGSIVPNGVDTERFDPARTIGHLRQTLGLIDRPVVGLAARPAPEKGMEVFAQTVRRTCQILPESIFLIAGEFGWRKYYEQHFAELGLSKHVRFLGHIDNMPDFFASCDVVVLTSPERSIEGSPNALLEAMSMARPVVASNIGGIPELLTHGKQGYLVRPDNPHGFAFSIVRILTNRATARRMGEAGRARVLASHSEMAAMDALVQALHRFGGSVPTA